MPRIYDSPVRPEHVAKPSERLRLTQAQYKAVEDARLRRLVGEIAANAGQRPCDQVAAVAARSAELGAWEPTRPTICALAKKHRDAPPALREDLAYWMTTPHGGRPQAALPDALAAVFAYDAEHHSKLTTGQLIKRLHLSAKKFDCAAQMPKEDALRRIVNEGRGGVVKHASQLHGRRAATVDGIPHGTLPYTSTHDCWTEDELVMPIWIGMYSERLRRWRSTLLFLILVIDYASRAVVAFHLCDPRRRLPKGKEVFSGLDADDLTAAFLKAACPELAPACLRDFAGSLPRHARMDGPNVHRAWVEMFDTLIPTHVHLLGDYRPYRNGLHERAGGTIKDQFAALFADVQGHTNSYVPTDRIGQEQRAARSQAAATTDRVRRKTSILPENLLRISEVEEVLLPRLITLYNDERPHAAHGMTPRAAFMSNLPRAHDRIPGTNLVRALPIQSLAVQRGSFQIERTRGDRRIIHRFAAEIDRRMLRVGDVVDAHVHPLTRCIWVIDGPDRRLVHIPSAVESAQQTKASHVAKFNADLTGGLSERAQRTADNDAIERFGLEGFENTIAAAKRSIAGEPEPTRSPVPDAPFGSKTPDLGELVAQGSIAPADAAAVWLSMAPDADAPSPGEPATGGTPAPDSESASSTASPAPRVTSSRRSASAIWLSAPTVVSAPAVRAESPSDATNAQPDASNAA